MMHSVVHFVDDQSWGGVNRLLSCLENAPAGFLRDQHKIMRVQRGARRAVKLDADVIVSHMSICWKNLPFFSSLRSANPETPMVHVEHSYSERFVALKVKNRSRFDDLLHLSYALFDKIVAVSQPQSAWLQRRRFAHADQLVTISSCSPLEAFEAIAKTRPQGPVTIGAIGRFHEQKGFDILVDAFAKSARDDLRLLLVGDGPDHPMLLKKANGHSEIGFMARQAEPADAMALCDAIAMPSRWEPYGLVALEAMAAGRPVFCAAVDGLRQHISVGAIAVGENTVSGWAALLAGFPSRDGLNDLPKAKGSTGAGWAFVNAWNTLVHELTELSGNEQKAA